MSEALWGVVIGGIIASITPIVISLEGHYRWKRERKLDWLHHKRKSYDEAFAQASSQLSSALRDGVFPIYPLLVDLTVLFPTEVQEAFKSLTSVDLKNHEDVQDRYQEVCLAMKRSLKSIEDEIDKLVS